MVDKKINKESSSLSQLITHHPEKLARFGTDTSNSPDARKDGDIKNISNVPPLLLDTNNKIVPFNNNIRQPMERSKIFFKRRSVATVSTQSRDNYSNSITSGASERSDSTVRRRGYSSDTTINANKTNDNLRLQNHIRKQYRSPDIRTKQKYDKEIKMLRDKLLKSENEISSLMKKVKSTDVAREDAVTQLNSLKLRWEEEVQQNRTDANGIYDLYAQISTLDSDLLAAHAKLEESDGSKNQLQVELNEMKLTLHGVQENQEYTEQNKQDLFNQYMKVEEDLTIELIEKEKIVENVSRSRNEINELRASLQEQEKLLAHSVECKENILDKLERTEASVAENIRYHEELRKVDTELLDDMTQKYHIILEKYKHCEEMEAEEKVKGEKHYDELNECLNREESLINEMKSLYEQNKAYEFTVQTLNDKVGLVEENAEQRFRQEILDLQLKIEDQSKEVEQSLVLRSNSFPEQNNSQDELMKINHSLNFDNGILKGKIEFLQTEIKFYQQSREDDRKFYQDDMQKILSMQDTFRQSHDYDDNKLRENDKKKIKELEDEIEKYIKQKKQMEDENEKSNKQKKAMEDEIENCNKQKKAMEDEIEKCNKQKKAINEENLKYRTDDKKKIQQLEEEIHKLYSQKEDTILKKIRNDDKELINTLHEEIKNLKKVDYIQKQKEEDQIKIEQLQDDIKNIRKQRDNDQKNNNNLQDEIQKKEVAMQKQKGDDQQKIEILQNEIKHFHQKKEEEIIEKSREKDKQTIHTLQEEIKKLQTKKEDDLVQKCLEADKQTIRTLQEEITLLHKYKDIHNRTHDTSIIDHLEIENKKAQTTIETLQDEIHILQSKYEEALDVFKYQDNNFRATTSDIQELLDHQKQLETITEEQEKKLQSAGQNQKRLSHKLIDQSEETMEIEKILLYHQHESEQTQKKYDEQLNNLMTEIEQYKNQLKIMQGERIQDTEIINVLKVENDTLKKYEEVMNVVQAENENLKFQVDMRVKDIQDMESFTLELQKELNTIHSSDPISKNTIPIILDIKNDKEDSNESSENVFRELSIRLTSKSIPENPKKNCEEISNPSTNPSKESTNPSVPSSKLENHRFGLVSLQSNL